MKKIFKRIWEFIKNPAPVLADAKKIIHVLRIVRQVLGTEAANNITRLIPGTVDDRIVAAVKTGLDTVLKYADALDALNDVIPQSNLHLQNAILHKTASQALRKLHPDIDEATADLIIQRTYHRHF